MLRSVKAGLLVAGKRARYVHRVIGRVEVHKVSFACLCHRRGEIALREGHIIIRKIAVHRAQRAFIADGGILITPKRGVELPRRVHAIQAVIAGAVEVQRPRGALNGGEGGKPLGIPVHCAQRIEKLCLIGIARELGNELIDAVAHHLIEVDEFTIEIVDPCSGRLEREKHRAATDEGFIKTPRGIRRQGGVDMRQELALPARPFDQWLNVFHR